MSHAAGLRHAALLLVLVLPAPPACRPAAADEALADTIERIKPAVVGVGTYAEIRRPPAQFRGTGFAVGSGNRIATNEHVISPPLDAAINERLVVFIGRGKEVEYRPATVAVVDTEHDLALLDIPGAPLPALAPSPAGPPREGTSIAFTGFPIGAVLGLNPVTTQGIVSALTPIALPADRSDQLSTDKLLALRHPFEVLQLDATAYPGNSGSPVYRHDDGTVVGIVNMVFVKARKEDMLRDPSAITYAIPSRFLHELLAAPRGAAAR